MTPDPSLNERLAEKLGWRQSEHGNWISPDTPPGLISLQPPPEYASSYAGMGVVLEEMRGRGERVWADFAYALLQRLELPPVGPLEEQMCPHGVIQKLLMRLSPEFVAQAALAALEGEG